MKNRKAYCTPSAEVILLTPCEEITSNSFSFGKGNGWWNAGSTVWWGSSAANASVVTGMVSIPDEDGRSWTID